MPLRFETYLEVRILLSLSLSLSVFLSLFLSLCFFFREERQREEEGERLSEINLECHALGIILLVSVYLS